MLCTQNVHPQQMEWSVSHVQLPIGKADIDVLMTMYYVTVRISTNLPFPSEETYSVIIIKLKLEDTFWCWQFFHWRKLMNVIFFYRFYWLSRRCRWGSSSLYVLQNGELESWIFLYHLKHENSSYFSTQSHEIQLWSIFMSELTSHHHIFFFFSFPPRRKLIWMSLPMHF